MQDGLLYERSLPQGPLVRIRRTSESGVIPVIAVLEVERRAGTARAHAGLPPALKQCVASTESEVLTILEQEARDDSVVARLMRERGLR